MKCLPSATLNFLSISVFFFALYDFTCFSVYFVFVLVFTCIEINLINKTFSFFVKLDLKTLYIGFF